MNTPTYIIAITDVNKETTYYEYGEITTAINQLVIYKKYGYIARIFEQMIIDEI